MIDPYVHMAFVNKVCTVSECLKKLSGNGVCAMSGDHTREW